MSNIQDNLEQIQTARYGRDVRQAIHDAIVEIYEIVDELDELVGTGEIE